MADDIIEQIRPHIQEVLRIVLDVQGRTLRELNELVGQTSKFDSQFITNVHTKVMIVQTFISDQIHKMVGAERRQIIEVQVSQIGIPLPRHSADGFL